MRLLPYTRATLRSSEAPDVVAGRLEKMLPDASFLARNVPQPFRGTLDGHRFKIARILGTFLGLPFHNSWLPVIVGEIVPAPGGTEVRLTMRPNAFVSAFTAVWFAALTTFVTIFLWIAVREGDGEAWAGFLLGCGMLAFMYAVVSLAFWPEVRKATVLLREGLGCGDADAPNRLVRRG